MHKISIQINFPLLMLLLVTVSCGLVQTENDLNNKTIETMRGIGRAVEAYAEANGGKYPVQQTGEISGIREQLVPRFAPQLKKLDASQHPIRYYCFHDSGPYYIIALGEDHKEDVGIYHSPGKPDHTAFITIDDPKEDIIFSNGKFVRYPKGLRSTGIKGKED
jgi:hypothetical protein